MSFKRLGLRSGSLAAALLAVFASTSAASVRVPLSGWYWGNPAPQGNALKAVDFVGGRGYAVGTAGTALRSDDGGLTWSGLATGTAGDLTRLQIIDPETVVVLGGGGCVLRRTDDGGKTFKKIFIVAEVNCPDRVQAMNFVDKTTGYLLLADGSVLKTTDAGDSFSKQTAIPGTARERDARRRDRQGHPLHRPRRRHRVRLAAGGGNSAAFFTTDAGHLVEAADDPRRQRRQALPLRRQHDLRRSATATLLRSDDARRDVRQAGVRRRADADVDRLRRPEPLPHHDRAGRAEPHDGRRRDRDADHGVERAARRRRVRERGSGGGRRRRRADGRLQRRRHQLHARSAATSAGRSSRCAAARSRRRRSRRAPRARSR